MPEIWRVNLDGTDINQVVQRIVESFGIPAIAFNPGDQKVYWSEHGGGIWRSSPDGDDVQPIVGPRWFDAGALVDYHSDAHAIVFDKTFMYWGAGIEPNRVSRMNLADSTGVEPIITTENPWVEGLAVDADSGCLYWAEEQTCSPVCTSAGTGKVKRANLDGSNISELASVKNPGKVALDGNGFLYWTDNDLYRSRLDGSEAVQIISNVSTFAVDSQTDSIIFARNGDRPDPTLPGNSTLMRANTSGQEIQTILTLPFQVRDMALRIIEASAIPGDFNSNGVVDASDYVVWRDGFGTTFDQSDYDAWRAHFSQTAGNGPIAIGSVPEPATLTLLLLAAVGECIRECRKLRLTLNFDGTSDLSQHLIGTSHVATLYFARALPLAMPRARRAAGSLAAAMSVAMLA
jgi:hypothetical protein